jgi:hypothetical protein
LLACALGAASGAATAQSTGDLFTQGIRAYRDLDFDGAAGVLRREIVRLAASGAPVKDRAAALVYLGAADLFRGRRDSAAAAFRRLVLLDPRYRPDQLVFPPEVTAAFESARQATKSVLIVAPRDTEITLGGGSFGVWLVASSFHTIEVTLRYEDGGLFRRLYSGPIGDSLDVQWDGLDAADAPPAVGRLLLRVASHTPTLGPPTLQQLPLELRVRQTDSLPWPLAPPASRFLPERSASGPAKRTLIGGVLLSAAVVSLPSLVGGRETSGGRRFAVAGAVGMATVLGYLLHRPGRSLDANIRANQQVLAAWEEQVAAVRAENARRALRLVIRAGEPAALQSRGP